MARERGFTVDKSGEISTNDLCRIIIGELREMKSRDEETYTEEGYNLAINSAEDKIRQIYKRETGYDLYEGC